MGIIDRIKLNIRANLNYALDKAEDPQKVFDQFLLDMEESIRAFKESIVNAIADLKILESEMTDNSGKVSLWEERALLALRRGDEDLAKKALDRKQTYAEKDRQLREDIEKQKQTVDELKASLPVLESKLNDLRLKRAKLISKKVPQNMPGKINEAQLGIDSGVFDVYDTMVNKIRTMEYYAEALSELSRSDDVESKFKTMEKESLIESELKAMKESIQPKI